MKISIKTANRGGFFVVTYIMKSELPVQTGSFEHTYRRKINNKTVRFFENRCTLGRPFSYLRPFLYFDPLTLLRPKPYFEFLAKLYFDQNCTSTCASRPIRNTDLKKGRSKADEVQKTIHHAAPSYSIVYAILYAYYMLHIAYKV